MSSIGDSIDRALDSAAASTRPIPKTAGARMRYLVRQAGGTRAAAQQLGISQRTVQRYLAGQRKTPTTKVAERLESAVKSTWQPRVRQRAIRRAITTGGVRVETRAKFGFRGAPGTTDDPRMRRITRELPPEYADQILSAQEAGADEKELQRIIAEALKEEYFKASGARAHSISQVWFNEVDYIEFDIG